MVCFIGRESKKETKNTHGGKPRPTIEFQRKAIAATDYKKRSSLLSFPVQGRSDGADVCRGADVCPVLFLLSKPSHPDKMPHKLSPKPVRRRPGLVLVLPFAF